MLSAAEITARLRLEPSRSTEKGFRPNKHATRVLQKSIWSRGSGLPNDVPLDEQLAALLDVLEPLHAELAALRGDGCTTEFFTGFASANGQGGITLDPVLLGRIAALGIDLSLDLYPPSDIRSDHHTWP